MIGRPFPRFAFVFLSFAVMLTVVCSAWNQLNVVSGTGIIRFFDLEGGFYCIIDSDGKHYYPINLSEEFQVDGLRVYFEAKILQDEGTSQMQEIAVSVLKIQKL